MKDSMSRRAVLRRCAVAAVAVSAGGRIITSNAAPAKHSPGSGDGVHVNMDDELASSLSYHESSTAVDPKRFSSYRPGQQCSTCAQSSGAAGAEWRSCALFPGKLVNARGWCEAYSPRRA